MLSIERVQQLLGEYVSPQFEVKCPLAAFDGIGVKIWQEKKLGNKDCVHEATFVIGADHNEFDVQEKVDAAEAAIDAMVLSQILVVKKKQDA